ncbi:MAG TPA: hypothetical protein VFX50_12540, partial [Gemmatimonadales bacterium]|nr:hypothetical protein [Gemmatimonadales bacterium]
FAVFALLHWRAYAVAGPLGLSAVERRRAWIGLRTHLLSVAVGVLSVLLVFGLPPRLVGLAGFIYAVLGPVHAWHGWYSRPAIEGDA